MEGVHNLDDFAHTSLATTSREDLRAFVHML
jgi:hypothetical protein